MRAILVSYSDRNKIVKIPDYNPENDLTYLEREFRKLFLLEGNVAIHVSFQKFHPDWEEYVELDEDEILDHKDKVKVVVTSRIITPASSSTSVEIDENSVTPCGSSICLNPRRLTDNELGETDSLKRGVSQTSKEVENNTLLLPSTSNVDDIFTNDSDDDPLPPPIRKRPLRKLDEALEIDENNNEFSYLNMEKSNENQDARVKKKKIEKSEEDAVPLPDPFPLPKHYSAEVEANLKAKTMTNVTRRAFIGKIAASMLYYKRYPTSDDYINVGRAIIEAYPFMKSPVGSPAGAIITSLKNVFKEFRRDKEKKRINAIATHPRSSVKPKQPASVVQVLLPIPAGDDEVSLIRHVNALQEEYKKRLPNSQIVEELMTLSFPLRRNDILSNTYDLQMLFKKYPFLNSVKQIANEMQRIIGNGDLISTAKIKWDGVTEKILQQASLEAAHKTKLRNKLKEIDKSANKSLAAISILPLLLPDARSSADDEKIVYFTKGATNIETIVREKKQFQPYIVLTGDINHPNQAFLVIDCQVISNEVDIDSIGFILLAAYFVFNICYIKGCTNFFSYLEVLFLNANIDKVSSSVKHFITALHTCSINH